MAGLTPQGQTPTDSGGSLTLGRQKQALGGHFHDLGTSLNPRGHTPGMSHLEFDQLSVWGCDSVTHELGMVNVPCWSMNWPPGLNNDGAEAVSLVNPAHSICTDCTDSSTGVFPSCLRFQSSHHGQMQVQCIA